MAGSSGEPWSTNPNAPQIPYSLYFAEKASFAGFLIGAILYGIVIILFFQCMGALLDPVNRARQGVKWKLVAHTAAMFSFATIYIATTLQVDSVSYIDNREFSGDDVLPPGPFGYQFLIFSEAISIVPQTMFFLNNWLADGLLLYRCFVIYTRSYQAIAFPFLMYLASLAMGIMFIYRSSQPDTLATESAPIINFGAPFLSISLSLNVLLTLMIVARLIWHRRNIRNAFDSTVTSGGLYNTAITILVESSALYAVSFLLFIGLWGARNPVQYTFLQILAQTQVIAPFLIIIRVANRSALTSGAVVSRGVSSIRFRRPGQSTVGGETLPDGYPANSMDAYGGIPEEIAVGVETTIDLHHDKVSVSEGSLKT